MKYLKHFLILTCIFNFSSCSNSSSKEIITDTKRNDSTVAINYIDSIPKIVSKYYHEVLVLGSAHFDRSTNGSDVVGKNVIDITSAQNQKEVDALVTMIVNEFKPTIVAIEFMPKHQKAIDTIYARYLRGEWKLKKNEAYQIGFRVAQKMKLSTVYCIDNRPPQTESITSIDDWDKHAEDMHHTGIWHEYDNENNEYNAFMDNLQSKTGVLGYLEVANSKETSKRNKQLWLTGLVNLGHGESYLGADLTGNWYRRNTRLFTNARNLCKTKNEKVLIIYGLAHKWVLDELFEGSPEFIVKQLF